MIENTVSLGAL